MSMRDWLIIIVIVGIVLILVDGYRRKHKNSIRIKIDKNIPPPGNDDDPLETAELPNGGARITPRGNAATFASLQNEADEDDFDENVPLLMDAVNLAKDKSAAQRKDYVPVKPESDDFDQENADDYSYEEDSDSDEDPADESANSIARTSSVYNRYDEEMQAESEDFDQDYENNDAEVEEEEEAEDQLEEDAGDDENIVSSVKVSHRETPVSSGRESRIEPSFGELDPLSADDWEDKPAHLRETDKKSKKEAKKENKKKQELAARQTELFSDSPGDYYSEEDKEDEHTQEPEEVIVINVMAKSGEHFAGKDLLPILLKQGMQLGKMSIFHKHADADANGPVMFSMANIVKPGTFDVTQMDEFTTPGVSFFLQLPNKLGNMRCFEEMLQAANSIRESLHGDLKDEHRSVITRQTIEHCRQRIQDFELAQLSRK